MFTLYNKCYLSGIYYTMFTLCTMYYISEIHYSIAIPVFYGLITLCLQYELLVCGIPLLYFLWILLHLFVAFVNLLISFECNISFMRELLLTTEETQFSCIKGIVENFVNSGNGLFITCYSIKLLYVRL